MAGRSVGACVFNEPLKILHDLLPIIEADRQLREGCGQVTNADVALVRGNGGVISGQVTAVLGSESTFQDCASRDEITRD